MITDYEYKIYFGVETAPNNLTRLEYLSINALKSIMVGSIPKNGDAFFQDFKKAVIEQINYFDKNPELIDQIDGGNYSLGSYSESSSSQNKTECKKEISPQARNILLNSGLLYCGMVGW